MKRFIFCLLATMLACATLSAQETITIAPAANRTADTTPDTQRNVRRVPNDTGKSPKIDAGEIAVLDMETNEWIIESDPFPAQKHSVADLYMQGGGGCMTLI
ncbi:MAG: hypothetical protein K2G66_00590, partial [Alistipes sp.]|nr:hypothetical protein [Alistipes sp.]